MPHRSLPSIYKKSSHMFYCDLTFYKIIVLLFITCLTYHGQLQASPTENVLVIEIVITVRVIKLVFIEYGETFPPLSSPPTTDNSFSSSKSIFLAVSLVLFKCF